MKLHFCCSWNKFLQTNVNLAFEKDGHALNAHWGTHAPTAASAMCIGSGLSLAKLWEWKSKEDLRTNITSSNSNANLPYLYTEWNDDCDKAPYFFFGSFTIESPNACFNYPYGIWAQRNSVCTHSNIIHPGAGHLQATQNSRHESGPCGKMPTFNAFTSFRMLPITTQCLKSKPRMAASLARRELRFLGCCLGS